VFAQANPQLSLALIGRGAGQYITPTGETTKLKMEILNVAPSEVYLQQGDAYLDPKLNGTWENVHSESLGNFNLGYLQSAIWTFDLTMPPKIQAANVTNGMPQVDLLIKIVYLTAYGSQGTQQGVFGLSVPGASVQETSDVIWFTLAGIMVVAVVGTVLVKRRRAR
jgi:LPXTG-motif cell wall-anchored protein